MRGVSEEDLRKRLSPQQYHVTQEGGTDPPFCNEYYHNRAPGAYHCIVCGRTLFASDAKYDSGSGWPSFTAPAADDAVATRTDTSHGMVREEALCAKCGAHLGHVFRDGPREAGGLRYCINSSSLGFDAAPGPRSE